MDSEKNERFMQSVSFDEALAKTGNGSVIKYLQP